MFLIIRFGQFIVATLPLTSERNLILREGEGNKEGEGEIILLRNRCLQLLHSLLFNGSKINSRYIDAPYEFQEQTSDYATCCIGTEVYLNFLLNLD